MVTLFAGPLIGRRAIALLVAYALALQAFLPVVVAVAAPMAGPICAADGRDAPAPMNHGSRGESQCPCCVGAMLCAAAALPPPAEPVFALKLEQIQSGVSWPVLSPSELSHLLRRAHPARGPPVS